MRYRYITKGNCENYSKRLASVSSIKLDVSSINAIRDAAVRKCERSARASACPLRVYALWYEAITVFQRYSYPDTA